MRPKQAPDITVEAPADEKRQYEEQARETSAKVVNRVEAHVVTGLVD